MKRFILVGMAAAAEPAAQTVKLEQLLQKPNAIIDTEEWFSENDIEKPFYDIPPAER